MCQYSAHSHVTHGAPSARIVLRPPLKKYYFSSPRIWARALRSRSISVLFKCLSSWLRVDTTTLVSRFQRCWLCKLHILHIPAERTVVSVSSDDNCWSFPVSELLHIEFFGASRSAIFSSWRLHVHFLTQAQNTYLQVYICCLYSRPLLIFVSRINRLDLYNLISSWKLI